MAYVRTFTVTVSGGKYYIDSVQQPTINLAEGGLYKFDLSDSSNNGLNFRFSTTNDGTHSGGSIYTTGVGTSGTPGTADAYLEIQVSAGGQTPAAPDPIYYFDTTTSGMGGQANTPTAASYGMRSWGDNQWSNQNEVDASLTGLGLTSSIGDVTAYPEQGWGRDTYGIENWGESGFTLTLSGLSVTASVGDLTAVRYPGWGTLDWGENGWGSVDEATETLTGLSATAAVGAIAPADVMGLTGVGATSSVGEPLIISSPTVSLSGQSSTVSVGAITPTEMAIGLSTAGVGTTGVGAIAPADVMGLTGIGATVSSGTITVASVELVDVTGVGATSSVGSISLADMTVGLTGLSRTSGVGSISPTEMTVGLTGISATISLGELSPLYYRELNYATSASYSVKTYNTSASYTEKKHAG